MNENVDNGFNALNGRVDKLETRMVKLEGKFSQVQESNSQEHQQLMQMVKELDLKSK